MHSTDEMDALHSVFQIPEYETLKGSMDVDGQDTQIPSLFTIHKLFMVLNFPISV